VFAPRVKRGSWHTSADENALVVNTQLLADQPELDVGGEATLIIAGKSTRWTVVGVVETGLSPGAFARRDVFARIVSDGRMSVVAVAGAIKGTNAQLDLIARLRAELAQGGFTVQSTQLVQANRAAIEDHLLMVAGFLGIMAQLMIVVGGLGLAATMSLAVLERTREIGVLRAIGARHRSILMMIQVEGLVIAALSWMIALPLSLPMSVALGNAFGKIMIPVPISYVPEPSGVLRWLIVVVVVAIIACAWPAIRATRITTAAALSYE
jgi:putative ABC transport system permease protein